MEKLHGKGGDVPKEMKYSREVEAISKIVPDRIVDDQVSSSNETINVDEEEAANIVIKKENLTEETAGKQSMK